MLEYEPQSFIPVGLIFKRVYTWDFRWRYNGKKFVFVLILDQIGYNYQIRTAPSGTLRVNMPIKAYIHFSLVAIAISVFAVSNSGDATWCLCTKHIIHFVLWIEFSLAMNLAQCKQTQLIFLSSSPRINRHHRVSSEGQGSEEGEGGHLLLAFF